MSRSRRRSLAGFPLRVPRSSRETAAKVVPQVGYTEIPNINAPPGSLVSAQNIWVRPGLWEPRSKLLQHGTNIPTPDVPNGSMVYHDVTGPRTPVITSKGTISFLDVDIWQPLTYISGTSDFPPTGSANDLFFGDVVYLPRADANLLVFTNGTDPLYAWAGPSNGTGFSTLTQSPICHDVAVFDNRPIAWNVRDISGVSHLVQRVQWPVRGDPEDWTGIGSGFADLLDMRGEGTRIFAEEDELILFSSEEIWRGRKSGPPFFFTFSPLNTNIGLPFSRAALQTENGIFWYDRDFMVWHLENGRLDAVGGAIQHTIKDEDADPERTFFTWNPGNRDLSIWYTDTAAESPNKKFTLDLHAKQWTRHTHAHRVSVGWEAPITSSSASTYGGMPGTFAAYPIQTFAQLAGETKLLTDGVAGSAGTAYSLVTSVTSDDGATVLHEAVFGGLLTEPDTAVKFLKSVRLNASSLGGTSAVSVAVSGDLGRTFAQERLVSVQSTSESSQYVTRFGVSGTYPTVRLRSEANGWQIQGFTLRGQVRGESS